MYVTCADTEIFSGWGWGWVGPRDIYDFKRDPRPIFYNFTMQI